MSISDKSKWVVVLLCVFLLWTAVGCKKKVQTIARPPAGKTGPASTGPSGQFPSPTVELTASPNTLHPGESATLAWKAGDAESVLIDGGIGNVSTSGSVSVSPRESTTYTATAKGRGGEAKASVRVTVVAGGGTGAVVSTDLEALRKAIEEGLVRPIFFSYDSAELSAEAKSILDENSKYFRRYPGARVIIEGHCDERGSEEYNLALGDRRAQAAKEYLVQLGVTPSLLETISYGEERPYAQGSDEASWAQNRRAQFVAR